MTLLVNDYRISCDLGLTVDMINIIGLFLFNLSRFDELVTSREEHSLLS